MKLGRKWSQRASIIFLVLLGASLVFKDGDMLAVSISLAASYSMSKRELLVSRKSRFGVPAKDPATLGRRVRGTPPGGLYVSGSSIVSVSSITLEYGGVFLESDIGIAINANFDLS